MGSPKTRLPEKMLTKTGRDDVKVQGSYTFTLDTLKAQGNSEQWEGWPTGSETTQLEAEVWANRAAIKVGTDVCAAGCDPKWLQAGASISGEGESLGDLGLDDEFLDTKWKAQSMKERIGKLDVIKIKIFYSARDTVRRRERQALDWENMFAKVKSNEGLVFKVYKELSKVNTKKTHDLVTKWVHI